MIQVYPISKKVNKYCSHCDEPAIFEIWFCNENLVQKTASGCLCKKCITRLKNEIIIATMKKPVLIEKFADNGEHSHWELIDTEGNILWSEQEKYYIGSTLKDICQTNRT